MRARLAPLGLLLAGCASLGPGERHADPTRWVDPFIGTAAHGHTYPGATVPFGMVQLSPDNGRNGWDWVSGYHRPDSVLVGFSHTHLSGTGIGDLADILFLPVGGAVDPARTSLGLDDGELHARFDPASERAEPGFYAVTLTAPGPSPAAAGPTAVRAELTASTRVGWHRYGWPHDAEPALFIDLGHAINWDRPVETRLRVHGDTLVTGHRFSRGWAEDQRVFFAARFSRPIAEASLALDSARVSGAAAGARTRAVLRFARADGEPLVVKVGISYVDEDGALRNLAAEAPGWDFDAARRAARAAWRDALSSVRVATSDTARLRTFYTALYHTKLAPVVFEDVDGRHRGGDGAVHPAAGYNRYSIFSLWDTFRAQHPLLTIVEPGRVGDMVASMLAFRREHGLLPVWELVGNETNTMTGYHAVPVVADAFLKGIGGFDPGEALEAMVETAMQDARGVAEYRRYGFIPSELEVESVTKTLEYAFDDWAIARTAAALRDASPGGRDSLAALEGRFLERSGSWRNVFDPATRFMRGRHADGAWVEPFDPYRSEHRENTDYTEGNAWQHSWFVPHDVRGLIDAMGGDVAFVAKLDSLFAADTTLTGENVSSDISGMLGQYAHGNEPSHHIAYLYSYAGAPGKTAERVRAILDRLYDDSAAGLPGNEDCGQLSAWYVLSVLGFYPVNPVGGVYVLGSPVFDEADIRVGPGRTFRIEAPGTSAENRYIQGATLNGRPLTRSWITHEEVMAGGTLVLTMGSAPHPSWGTARGDRPPSESDDAPAPAPPARTEARALHEGWHLRGAGTDASYPATIPGTVHTDLLAAGVIPDPFLGTNEDSVQWIEARDWEYATSFRLTDGEARAHHVELLFEGLDTYATVTLNGDTVLEADNMFRPWRVDATPHLQSGENDLRVRFRSPIAIEEAKRAAYPHPLPAGNDPHGTRVFSRKAAYHYGWDWGPRLVTSGIWRPARLRAWSAATPRDVWIEQRTLTDAKAELRAHVEVEADRVVSGAVVVRSPRSEFENVEREVRLEPGRNDIVLDFTIEHPERWWPNGLGEARLYDVVVELDAGGEPRGEIRRRIGLRTLEVVSEPDSIGRSFFVRVNGAPVFMKGANHVPLDHFSPRADSADYARLFEDIAVANMNMVRVWGGGIYERDLFYDLADEQGILVWQDFMFANAFYPGDSAFLAGVRAEAEAQVRRLRGHPSLALWAGNNEILEAWRNWGWQEQHGYTRVDSAGVWKAYADLFEGVLPSVVRELDPGRFYWPSSPLIGWGHPESLAHGDAHYWGVWWGEEPFEVFAEKVPRFMSEYGFQGYPDLETLARIALPGELRAGSPTLRAHQKHPRGEELIRSYMERWFPEPRDFESFVYLSQLLQAEGMKVAFEAHRRAMPRTMGTLYWQLGDTWPVVSWSSRDWFGRWKALHHYARRAFAPLLVSPAIDGDTVRVHVVWDGLESLSGTLTVRVVGFDGGEALRVEQPVAVPANGARVALALPLRFVLDDVDPARAALVAEVAASDGSRARGLLWFDVPKALALPEPGLTAAARREGERWVVEVSSRALARGVTVRFPGVDGRLSDDYFDLLPGETRWMTFTPDRPVESLPRPVVRSLVDAY